MSDAAVSVEGLGKKYNLRHAQNRAPYNSLRDTLQNGIRGIFKPARAKRQRYEEFWALKDVSFEIGRGEVVGVIGRNGAGKSTLLKLLSRITEPSEGRVTLRGRIASLLEVGTGFHPELTGRENIFLNGAILGMNAAEIRSKFDDIVSFAEVEKFLDTQVKHYSSGMYVRLAFAVAAHLEPEILVLDEVLAVGDQAFQRKCLAQIHNVAQGGRTVLIVSHQLDVIKRLATKAILLQGGRLQMFDQVAPVVSSYLDQPVARDATFQQVDRPHIASVSVDFEKLTAGHLMISVAYQSPDPIGTPTVGIVVSTLGGPPIFGSNTLMHPSAHQARFVTSGTASLELVNVPLLSGDYSVSVWLSDRENNLDFQPHAVTFSYQDPNPPPFYADPRVQGPTKITPVWHFLE